MTPCPTCGLSLGGLATFCWHCEQYVDDMVGATTDATPEAREQLKDTRSEDERKRDALPTVTALGWDVLDFEQGYRPDDCPKCHARLPGGHSTRVPTGVGDWLCQGFGLAVWIEWKTDTNKQTDTQLRFEDRCDAAGVPYAVCRTTHEVVQILEAFKAAALASRTA